MELSCPICFARQTLIATPTGARPIETLQTGDLIMVQGAAPCPIRWIGSTRSGPQELHHLPRLRPVRIRAGALGAGLPLRDLVVSRQHRLLWPPAAPPDSAHLVAAIHLTGLPGVAIDETVSEVEYFHILLDRHHLVFAEGAHGRLVEVRWKHDIPARLCRLGLLCLGWRGCWRGGQG